MTAYILLNHNLTEKQVAELQSRYQCTEIAFPPKNISELWSQVSPDQSVDSDLLSPILSWLKTAEKKSPVVVSGDFGMTFAVVDWCLNNNLVPLYAATKRTSTEIREGETVKKTNVFEHICFKEYVRLGDM